MQMPMEARRGHWILWSWNYRQLSAGAVLWVLGMELGYSGKAARTLHNSAISPVQGLLLANRKGKMGPTLCCNFIRKKLEGCYEFITMGLRILKNANSSQWSKVKLLYSMRDKNDICPQALFSLSN